MRYFLDCEFDGFGGPLLSIALVREDNESIYIVLEHNVEEAKDPWVLKNVVPILKSIPSPMPGMAYFVNNDRDVAELLGRFLSYSAETPMVISDWPDDIKYLCSSLITGPGKMVGVGSVAFQFIRVDAYPTKVKNAVQHNAYWDALALKALLIG